jgi:phosphoesterase RecJ-like protein
MTINQVISERIRSSESFLIVSHVRPDADAVGSVLGIGLALRKAGKSPQMVLSDGIGKYSFLPGSEFITTTPIQPVDMIIILDCSDPARVGEVLDGFGKPDLVVDHHKTNLRFADINVVEPEQVATAAILHDHLSDWGLSIDQYVATCLLAGIVGDTIGFSTPNVDAEVLRKAANLMDFGADLSDIYQDEITNKSLDSVRYWGAGLTRLSHDDGIVWTSLTLADRKNIGYAGNDDADLVNVLSSINSAKIAMIFVEQNKNLVKISLRARPGIDVSSVALEFGGGGHAAAAGAEVEGSLEVVQSQVLEKTRKLLDKIDMENE